MSCDLSLSSICCLAYAIDSVQAEKCPCDVLNMEFFDKLWIEGLVNEEGEMKKLKHDYLGDIPVDDQVRSVSIVMCVCCYLLAS